MRNRTLRVALFGILPLVGVSMSGLVGCSKEEQKSAPASNASSSAQPDSAAKSSEVAKSNSPVDMAKSLLELVPKETVGFMVFQGKHPAYAQYKSSPWGSGSSNWSSMMKSANPETQQVTEMLKRLGFDLEDKNTFDKVLSEAAFFVAPPVSGETKPAIGVVFKPDSGFKLDDFLAKVKQEVVAGNAKVKVEDVKIGDAAGLRFEDSADGGAGANPMKEFFVASKGGLGVVSTSKKAIEGVITASAGTLPDIVSSPNFLKASSGMPSNESRFGTVFFDFEKFFAQAEKFGGTELAAKMKQNPFPVKAVSLAMAMDESPKTEFRMIYDDNSPQSREWFSTLASSPSESVLAAVSDKPLFFLSIDGQTIQKLKEKYLGQLGPQAAMLKPQLAALDGVSRIAFAAKSAGPGQSMLPIPEILVVAEAKEPAKLSAVVEQLVGPAVSGGMPGMQWQSSTENGVAVRALQSPMGMGAFLASSKNMFVLASTKGQLSSALKNVSDAGGAFSKSLSSPVQQVLAKQATIGNLYVNFSEVASALESVGGMLSMFAPQGNDAAQQFLSPENLQALRKMGSVVASVTVDPGVINVRSFYQKS